MNATEQQQASTAAGISGMALAVPPARVDLGQWCQWTGADAGKIRAVIGHGFRICDAQRNAYSLAATAALRLLEDYQVDPQQVGLLALGTESSTDNSAGAVIVRGMLDQALKARGRPALNRACEVPEFKHACLGGVYAIKNALRYLATDGAGKVAIVICSDIAEYERGSTGEPTQGAGAVALLLEPKAKMLSLDAAGGGSSSAYRGHDFRKPFSRYAGQEGHSRLLDFPLFNGRYSTSCYVDAVLAASRDFQQRQPETKSQQSNLSAFSAVFMHRPYHHMPRAGWEAIVLQALARDAKEGHDEAREMLANWCEEASLDYAALLAELSDSPDLLDLASSGDAAANGYPLTSQLARHFRRQPAYKEWIANRLLLGSEPMLELGNLYTAALPAWLAFGLAEAAQTDALNAGDAILLIGYGSGDAAELLPGKLVHGWQQAAARMRLEPAMAGACDLDQGQYEALHDGPADWHAPEDPLRGAEFLVAHVGDRDQGDAVDLGIEYYRLAD